MLDFPGYEIDGKVFKSVQGLSRYLMRKHNAHSHSCIGQDRILRVYNDDHSIKCAYDASAPIVGKPTLLTLR
jgi:hypothetical protein